MPRLVRAHKSAHGIDGLVAARTLEAQSEAHVAEILKAADAAGEAVVPIGGGTLLGIGNRPRRFDIALVTKRLSALHVYDYRDLTIGVVAGMTVAKFSATLAQHRQFIPLDAPNASHATVGGTLAAGWLGPRRAAYGRARDLLIGTTTVLADGMIVSANFKTLPMPPQFRLAVAPLPEGTRERAAQHVQRLEIEPTAALLLDGFRDVLPFEIGPEGAIVLAFEGSPSVIERATRSTRSALGAAGVPATRIVDAAAHEMFARIVDAYVATVPGRSLTLRVLGLPGGALARENAAREALAPTPALLDAIVDLRNGDAILRVFVDGRIDPLAVRGTLSDAVAALRARLPEATLLARGLVLDGEIDAWGSPPEALEMMRGIKGRFDPRGTLAPGRLVGEI